VIRTDRRKVIKTGGTNPKQRGIKGIQTKSGSTDGEERGEVLHAWSIGIEKEKGGGGLK